MKVYITPDRRAVFEKKVAKIAKHLSIEPHITISEPMMKMRTTHYIYNKGWGGYDKTKDYIEVCEVNIDIESETKWKLVATVYFKEEMVALCDSKLFKETPSYLGLKYKKCDACGHTSSNRAISHIFFNTETGEWQQLGSECAKMVFGTALDKFVVKLNEVVEISLGCTEDDFGEWVAKQPDHYFQQALNINLALSVTREYRKENPSWEKAWYDVNNIKHDGTTTLLNDYFDRYAGEIPVDEAYVAKVREYVMALPESDFNDSIRAAFENDFIPRHKIFTIFFAAKMYEESLTSGDWAKVVSEYPSGASIDLKGAKLLSKELVQDFYYGGNYWFARFSVNGITFRKSISNWFSFEDKFMDEDGSFTFNAAVKYIDGRRREIELGGRIRKCN